MTKLAHWFREVEESDLRSFNMLKKPSWYITTTFSISTHASAESFNVKVKNFRLQLRGVKDKTFFLFRLTQLLELIPKKGIEDANFLRK